ncbi:ISAs1 family transposase [Mesorhizobium sp. ASY16-5R]|uniref:ISAs1 family transposase n=1 Tax=Mesorhizobium sp. ASY16-5R TaxID=3445772 RepID=UPI003FA01444
MSVAILEGFEKSRLKSLLDHFGDIEDPREPWRVAHPLPEVLFLVVCGTICDCEDYDLIADWGAAHLDFLRRYLPYHHGVPGGRWLTILMNRIDPALFSECFTAWVRETWPDKPDFIAIDGKTSRRSHDRSIGRAPLHLVSAFATTQRLVLGQEAVCDKSNETTAIPVLLERLAANDGLKGALVSIDAIATNATIATAVRDAGADYLLAVKANQPTLRRDIERYFNDAPDETLDNSHDLDKGHGRIEERSVTVSRETDWLSGDRRFPGELRLPGATTIIRVSSRAELKDRCRFETRYYISSATLSAERAAHAVRGHWLVENALHWTLDVVFKDDQSRLRKGHGAHNMAIVRHFAINLVRAMKDNRAIKRRRKVAGWDADYLASILGHLTR